MKKGKIIIGLQFVIILLLTGYILHMNSYVVLESERPSDHVVSLLGKHDISYKTSGNEITVKKEDLKYAMYLLQAPLSVEKRDQQLLLARLDALKAGLESILWVDEANLNYVHKAGTFSYDGQMSVILDIVEDHVIAEEEVSGIVKYLVNSFENLPESKISIMDQDGKVLFEPAGLE